MGTVDYKLEIEILDEIYEQLLSVSEELEEFGIAPAPYQNGVKPDEFLFHAYPCVEAGMKFIVLAIQSRKEALGQNTE